MFILLVYFFTPDGVCLFALFWRGNLTPSETSGSPGPLSSKFFISFVSSHRPKLLCSCQAVSYNPLDGTCPFYLSSFKI